ncbi:rhomboid family intramembrane serine protease [Verrucomicrobiota bacterium]
MIIPYSTEVLIERWPISNLLIMALCVLFSALLMTGVLSPDAVEVMVLYGWSPIGLIGHMFLHAGFWHLVFNMLYLWVFGNAVCERLGSIFHVIVFLITGVLAGVVHNVFNCSPAVGASGAINGIIGFYLVLYPVNRINCFWWFLIRGGTFSISGFWLILFWFALDAWHAFSGAENGIAYWAHVGGFVSGVVLGFFFLKTGLVKMASYDNPTLLDYMSGEHNLRKGLAHEKESFIRPKLTSSYMESTGRSKKSDENLILSDINMDCPHCSQNLDIPQEMIGAAFQCPSCNGTIQLEAE